MADQVTVDNGTLTDYVVCSDEITSPYTGGAAQAQAVKLLSGTADSAAVIPGDTANGLDVDVTRVSGTVTVDSELTTADLDTGAGTDTRAVVGLALAASGGAVLAGTANPVPVSDNAGSLTIDSADLGLTTDAASAGNGSLIAITKQNRTLLNGGLPAALDGSGGLKVAVIATTIPAVTTIEAAYTAAQTDTAIVSATSPDRIVVTRITVVLDEATTVGTGFRVGLGATTTPTTTGVVASHPGMVPGGGITIGDGSGVLGIGAAGDDLRITSEVPTSGALRVVVSYYLTQ